MAKMQWRAQTAGSAGQGASLHFVIVGAALAVDLNQADLALGN